MDEIELEKWAGEESHKFIDWMEREHGFVPYGFHRQIKQLILTVIKSCPNAPLKEKTNE
jgi:hypothetical protein